MRTHSPLAATLLAFGTLFGAGLASLARGATPEVIGVAVAPDLAASSVTIYNHTTYLVYFSTTCNGSTWLAHTLEVGGNSNYDCLASQAMRVRFKKSWLSGCPNIDQTYTLSAQRNYFQSTACGMDLYAGS